MKQFLRIHLTVLLLTFCTVANSQNYEIYISDAGNFNNSPWQILKADATGENVETFISENLAWPQDIVFLEEENIMLISNLNNDQINRHNATTGDFIDNFATNADGPTRMKIGPDNLLYVLQWNGNGKVMRYQLDGTFVDEFTSTGIPDAIGIDWDGNGNLYVSSYTGDLVQRYDSDGNDLGTFIDSNLEGPTNIWFDDGGDLMVSDYNAGSIKRFNSAGEYQGEFIDDLNFCEGIAFLPDGNMLIGNGGTSSVREYDSDGEFIDDFIPSGTADLLTPNAVVMRELSTSSSKEVNGGSVKVWPTTGKRFYLRGTSGSKVRTVEVYNLKGEIIESPSISANLIWDASSRSSGVYIIKVILNPGKEISQKVVVME